MNGERDGFQPAVDYFKTQFLPFPEQSKSSHSTLKLDQQLAPEGSFNQT
jgi:hypothetical protein